MEAEIAMERLIHDVLEANLALPAHGLVQFTWGNASGIDRERGLVVIKPSGVDYSKLQPGDMSVLELSTGKHRSGLKPSSDAPTHLALYRAFDTVSGIVHTHSPWATIFAQAGRSIPPMGTTHADDFFGEIPCTEPMTGEDIEGDYEANTGRVIAELFRGKNPLEVPAALVCGHGPFTWGSSAGEAVYKAAVLEQVAMMAWHSLTLAPEQRISNALLSKHWMRKHGKDAYYGQV